MRVINGIEYPKGTHLIEGRWIQVVDKSTVIDKGPADVVEATPVDTGNKRSERVDINKAAVEELADLDGISEAAAKRIVQSRPFEDIDDLTRVKGIGKRTVNANRDRITA
jgi:competence protein ComEA